MASLRELEVKSTNKENPSQKENVINKVTYTEKKDLDREIRKVSNQIEKSEELIAALENQVAEIEKAISGGHIMSEEMKNPDFYSDYERVKNQLNKELKTWEELNNIHDELKSKRN
ncbi:MAG: hypothetical protein HC906_16480 [Bacteroidales bacterium]|nr:hypothetical protein [Bacteroidales bacterium]